MDFCTLRRPGDASAGTEHRHIRKAQTAARQNAEEKIIEKNTAVPGCKSEKEEVEPRGRK
jgi:hypothetical protein